MLEHRYIVWVKDPKNDLNFEEFYNEFLNEKVEGYECFEETYAGDWIDKIKRPVKEYIREQFKLAINDNYYISNTYFVNRRFASSLADYIATVGLPVEVEDIGGWDLEIVILCGDNEKVKSYLKNPDLNFDERFTYVSKWARGCGLKPRKKPNIALESRL